LTAVIVDGDVAPATAVDDQCVVGAPLRQDAPVVASIDDGGGAGASGGDARVVIAPDRCDAVAIIDGLTGDQRFFLAYAGS
jgi:hypothetical protein